MVQNRTLRQRQVRRTAAGLAPAQGSLDLALVSVVQNPEPVASFPKDVDARSRSGGMDRGEALDKRPGEVLSGVGKGRFPPETRRADAVLRRPGFVNGAGRHGSSRDED